MFESTEVTGEINKFTGLTRVKVLAINPNGKWLVENGFRNEEKEQDYSYDFNGNTGNKVVVYVESIDNKQCRGSIDFLISDDKGVSKSGKNLYADAFGGSSYAESKGEAKFVDENTSFHACKGVSELIGFIRTWVMIGSREPLKMNLEKINSGDFSDIIKLVEASEKAGKAKNTQFGVKALFGVNNSGYSVVYNKVFLPIEGKSFTKLKTALENSYTKFKADYQGTLELKAYEESMKIDLEDEATPDVEDDGVDDYGIPEADDTESDPLPF